MQQELSGEPGAHTGQSSASTSHPALQPVPGCPAGTWAAQTGIAGGFKSALAFHNLSPQLPMQGPYTFVYRTAPPQPAVLLTRNIHVYLKAG